MNESKRETYKLVEYKGREFKVNAYDPMTGNYILYQCLHLILPFGITDKLGDAFGDSFNSLSKGASKMSKQEFVQLQTDILSTIEEVYKSGMTSPVVRENGTYGIDNVTMGMIMQLLIISLIFNFEDFFSELPSLEELMP